MKRLSFILPFVLLILLSCEESNNNRMMELGYYEGVYTVTFNHGTPDSTIVSGNTELTLSENHYEITEHSYITPPYSWGGYDLTSTTIAFVDCTIHTAEFDWTLIISGEYNYKFDSKHLVMSQIVTQQKRKYTYDLVK